MGDSENEWLERIYGGDNVLNPHCGCRDMCWRGRDQHSESKVSHVGWTVQECLRCSRSTCRLAMK